MTTKRCTSPTTVCFRLAGAVLSGSPERGMAVARRIRTGSIGVNGGMFYGADAPFGGYQQSGIGPQCGIEGAATCVDDLRVGRRYRRFRRDRVLARSGVGHALTPEKLGGALSQGIPAFGDSIGGMNIAGGISAALFHRERTGETTEIDVSLLSTAWWAAGASVTQGMETGETMRSLMPDEIGPTVNPFLGNYLTSDGGTINLCIVNNISQ